MKIHLKKPQGVEFYVLILWKNHDNKKKKKNNNNNNNNKNRKKWIFPFKTAHNHHNVVLDHNNSS